ncbi:ZIP family metal transporter [Mesobacillus harenae]|uniref:ZIP family metal transporter n=1 Tax=Mesobacillus harenae TaxID=2213203 RepID=UPI001580E5F4|nr:ZIP family metal transporter [Mesobacillus harenae]
MQEAVIGILLSALATGAGAIPILFFTGISSKLRDILLAFASGVMMAATTFSLIPEALDASNLYVVSIGLLLGTLVLNFFDSRFTSDNLEIPKMNTIIDRKTVLVIIAITLHNLPEGLSVGVSYGAGAENLGAIIALAIGLQNAPEGFLVAIYLVSQKVSRITALIIATLTGLVEIVTGALGYVLASEVDMLVPYGLSFAAGAMLFVIYKELIPDSQEGVNKRFPTYAFIIGLIAMLGLIQKFGV